MARIILTPVARAFKAALPNSCLSVPCRAFLLPIGSRGNCQTFTDHDAAKVLFVHRAIGQNTSVAIGFLGLAVDPTLPQKFGHSVAGCLATRPIVAISVIAALPQLGCVDAEQANALVAEAKAVPVAGASIA